jgi:DNA replication protein DnaC
MTSSDRATVPPVADNLAPWMESMPASARLAAIAGREEARQKREAREAMTAAERAAEARKERAELADDARKELFAGRAAQRWAMWCASVPARYRDPRADETFRHRPFGHWLSRLDGGQHPERIAAWLESNSSTLLLVGPTGTGKTHAAMAAGYAAAGQAVHTRYVSQLDYLARLRPGGSDDPARDRWKALNTSLLIFDDLGAETEGGTEFVRREVCALFDGRLNEGRRQIVTLNANPDALAETFGDRIVDRLRSDAVVLKLDGGSRRRPARAPW